ncbi:MAG: RdgB/HAM1 family non-canonical purine NTP pyrophosphatase [Candidatus Micrarchaeia archaeon]|jgi:XTP/dITP diphosphohydrolase
MKIVLASRNAEKLKEMRRIVDGKSVEFVALPKNAPEAAENEKTFEGNALKKAKSACKFTKLPALADDSGICVDFLRGAPGVKSARFAPSDKARNAKLLHLLREAPKNNRGAEFVCVAALVFPDGREFVVRGEARGKIAEEERGRGGFGYDPIFIPAGFRRTYAELGRKIKNRISHRARAFLKMRGILKGLVKRGV